MKMSDSKNFVQGLFIKDRNERTPDFVLASYSIKVENFKKWLDENSSQAVNGWLNIDIKKSRAGTKYAELNTYKKPEGQTFAPTIANDESGQRIEHEPWPADEVPF